LPSNAELQTITTDEQATPDDDQLTPLVAVAVAGSLPVRLLQQLVTAAAATAAYSPGYCNKTESVWPRKRRSMAALINILKRLLAMEAMQSSL